ncbi:MAG: RNA methyltransferase [Spirochaetaceae bacterium]|nr:RNA methyltransferase [Spirochaetaceae bacterium]
MRSDPFPHPDIIEVDGVALPVAVVWSVLASHLTPARRQRVREVAARRSFAVATVLEHVHDDGNIAAVLRTCEGIGFPVVHVVRQAPSPGGPARPPNRVTQGADKWLEASWWDAGDPWLERLRADGYRVLATRVGAGPTIDQVDFSRPTAVVFGNEHAGVTDATAQAADGWFSIPMAGFTRSFNISVAVAMVLQHARRSRVASRGADGELTADQRLILEARYAVRSLPSAAALLRRALTDGSFDIDRVSHEGSDA